MDVKDAGRLGGKARAAQLTPEEYRELGIKGGTNRWADKTPEERSAHARMMAAAPRKPRAKKEKPVRVPKKRGPWPKKREGATSGPGSLSKRGPVAGGGPGSLSKSKEAPQEGENQ